MAKPYRYLLNLSYLGTSFRGAQRQLKIPNDNTTIQGNIEIALRGIKPVNEIHVTTSSRTDAGVHALHSTMHTDLQHKSGKPFETKYITYFLNKYFISHELPIRILSTFLVPDDFHCRYAVSRTYLYRLVMVHNFKSLTCHVPIEDLNRAYYRSSSQFSVEKFKSAAKLFEGYHDFRSFMGKAALKPDKITRRLIYKFDARERSNLLYSRYSIPDPWMRCSDSYTYIDIIVESSGFLYRQVRRMIAALIAVSEGTITEVDIQRMLTVPSQHSWDSRLKTVPASGLYLARVQYPPSVIDTFREW